MDGNGGKTQGDHGERALARIQEAVGFDATPQCSLDGDQHRVRIDLEGPDAELVEIIL